MKFKNCKRHTGKQIQNRIFEIRNMKVMVDFHLAELYHVPTKALNLAVERNADRFPKNFMFRLTRNEWDNLGVEDTCLAHLQSRELQCCRVC